MSFFGPHPPKICDDTARVKSGRLIKRLNLLWFSDQVHISEKFLQTLEAEIETKMKVILKVWRMKKGINEEEREVDLEIRTGSLVQFQSEGSEMV